MSEQRTRIMMLTASFGEGHVQVSKALKQEFLAHGIEDVQIVDLLQQAHPFLNKISRKLYIKSAQSLKYGVDYYGWSYYITRDNKADGVWNKYGFDLLGRKKLKEMVHHLRPDALINTFPFGAAPVVGHDMHIPTFTVITDYALHSRWLHHDNDKYYVATEELKAQMLERGFNSQQVQVSGIPIRQAFSRASPGSNRFLAQIDPSKKTVLILAGAYGVLDEIENMARVLRTYEDAQLAVVCGRNQNLEQKLNDVFPNDDKVHIFGFVEDIHELMALASCAVTKAGGITLTEALALRLPIFIYTPFPGQEKENAIFFEHKGIAQVSYSTNELAHQILHFLSNDSLSQQIKSNMSAIYKPDASNFIVEDILQTVTKKEPVLV